MIKSIFGAKLRRTRQAANMNQQDLAQLAGIDVNLLQAMEAGENEPSLTTLFMLSKVLETTPDTLIMPAWTEFK